MIQPDASERRATWLIFLPYGMANSPWAPPVPYAIVRVYPRRTPDRLFPSRSDTLVKCPLKVPPPNKSHFRIQGQSPDSESSKFI